MPHGGCTRRPHQVPSTIDCGLALLAFFCGAALTGCGTQATQAEVQKPALIVNELKLSPGELQQELAFAAATSREQHPGAAGEEPEWLGRLIERELLVQEAQQLGLDRQPEFMRTIERFWKEALIKQLLDRKAREINAQVHVYEPDIEAFSQQFPEEFEARDDMERAIRTHKQAEAMDQWIAQLKAQSRIVIDHEAIAKLQ
jgi:hypothetical protein